MAESAEVADYLQGAEYPCSSQTLIDVALGNGAPQKVLDVLRSLPQTTFDDVDAANEAITRTHPTP